MISYDEALERIVEVARPLGPERIPLDCAHSRFLAAPVIAMVDGPPFDVSAMDGYAVRETDLPEVRMVGTSWPGDAFEGLVSQGECVRIFTGASIPAGADRVVMQEMVRTQGGRIIVEGELGSGRHIRKRASDFARGDELLAAGRRLDARALVAAAGADMAELEVWRRPRVAILGTGDELAKPGQARSTPGSIPESVSLAVAGLTQEFGGKCIGRERLRDDHAALHEGAQRALDRADVIVMTGGASVGEKDYAKAVFAELGVALTFSKVAMKPGKPVWFGRAQGKLVMGLPGNPTSAMVTARLLLAPLLLGLAGGDPRNALAWRRAQLAVSLPPCADRETFIRARPSGEAVEPVSNQDSGSQRALAEADLLIRRRAGAPAAAAGDEVEVIAF